MLKGFGRGKVKKKERHQHDSYSVLDSFGFKEYKYLADYIKKKKLNFNQLLLI